MKNVANCDNYCELRNPWIIEFLNANGASACTGTSIWVLVFIYFKHLHLWSEKWFWMSIYLRMMVILNRESIQILQWHSVVLGIYWLSKLYQLYYQPQIRWEYPLNLSILISGGKETNKDSPSSGEWRGNSSNLKSPSHGWRIVVYETKFVGAIMIKISWNEVSKWVIIPFEVIDCVDICF